MSRMRPAHFYLDIRVLYQFGTVHAHLALAAQDRGSFRVQTVRRPFVQSVQRSRAQSSLLCQYFVAQSFSAQRRWRRRWRASELGRVHFAHTAHTQTKTCLPNNRLFAQPPFSNVPCRQERSLFILPHLNRPAMVISLIAHSILRSTRGCANGVGTTAATGALVARCQGPFGDDRLTPSQWPLINYVQNRGAARRGKRIQRAREAREKAAKRRLAEAQNPKLKKNFKSQVKVDRTQFKYQDERQRDLTSPDLPGDNVFFVDKFKKKRFSLDEILEFHRQVCHPDVFNQPDTLVSAIIELNLKMKIKKKRYIERLESTVCYPHVFRYQIRPRKIVALCKEESVREAARAAGASIVGGMDIVDQLKKNLLTTRDFDHVVCHNDILLDFANVKGMKGAPYFPNKGRGNFGDDLPELVRYFKDGIDYSLKRNPEEPEYGFIECYFGKLDMSDGQLLENLTTLFDSINRFKPLNLDNNKQFFERVSITTVANSESFFLKFWEITDEYCEVQN